jgi:hypothetical protein
MIISPEKARYCCLEGLLHIQLRSDTFIVAGTPGCTGGYSHFATIVASLLELLRGSNQIIEYPAGID